MSSRACEPIYDKQDQEGQNCNHGLKKINEDFSLFTYNYLKASENLLMSVYMQDKPQNENRPLNDAKNNPGLHNLILKGWGGQI